MNINMENMPLFTGDHVFMTQRGLVKASELEAGDVIQGIAGESKISKTFVNISVEDREKYHITDAMETYLEFSMCDDTIEVMKYQDGDIGFKSSLKDEAYLKPEQLAFICKWFNI